MARVPFLIMKLTKKLMPLSVLIFFVIASCTEKPISLISAEDGIQRIRSSHKSERWEETIQQVNEYRSRYPYSQFAAEAEFLQAEAYFKGSRYPEAIVAYEEFLKKNPNSANAHVAGHHIAASYDKQAPENIDNEQVNAIYAIDKYNIFLERFPQSDLKADAKERISILSRRVAENNLFVARFYWKKSLYSGALSRYLNLIQKYPQYEDIKKEAVERAASAYTELADILEKDPKSDQVSYFKNSSPADLRKKSEEIKTQSSKK